MKKTKWVYDGHRFPASIISLSARWYFRFQLSLRNVEELPFERGVIVSYETIRHWCDKVGAGFARIPDTSRTPTEGATASWSHRKRISISTALRRRRPISPTIHVCASIRQPLRTMNGCFMVRAARRSLTRFSRRRFKRTLRRRSRLHCVPEWASGRWPSIRPLTICEAGNSSGCCRTIT
jgi:hypothetical protein